MHMLENLKVGLRLPEPAPVAHTVCFTDAETIRMDT